MELLTICDAYRYVYSLQSIMQMIKKSSTGHDFLWLDSISLTLAVYISDMILAVACALSLMKLCMELFSTTYALSVSMEHSILQLLITQLDLTEWITTKQSLGHSVILTDVSRQTVTVCFYKSYKKVSQGHELESWIAYSTPSDLVTTICTWNAYLALIPHILHSIINFTWILSIDHSLLPLIHIKIIRTHTLFQTTLTKASVEICCWFIDVFTLELSRGIPPKRTCSMRVCSGSWGWWSTGLWHTSGHWALRMHSWLICCLLHCSCPGLIDMMTGNLVDLRLVISDAAAGSSLSVGTSLIGQRWTFAGGGNLNLAQVMSCLCSLPLWFPPE